MTALYTELERELAAVRLEGEELAAMSRGYEEHQTVNRPLVRCGV